MRVRFEDKKGQVYVVSPIRIYRDENGYIRMYCEQKTENDSRAPLCFGYVSEKKIDSGLYKKLTGDLLEQGFVDLCFAEEFPFREDLVKATNN